MCSSCHRSPSLGWSRCLGSPPGEGRREKDTGLLLVLHRSGLAAEGMTDPTMGLTLLLSGSTLRTSVSLLSCLFLISYSLDFDVLIIVVVVFIFIFVCLIIFSFCIIWCLFSYSYYQFDIIFVGSFDVYVLLYLELILQLFCYLWYTRDT